MLSNQQKISSSSRRQRRPTVSQIILGNAEMPEAVPYLSSAPIPAIGAPPAAAPAPGPVNISYLGDTGMAVSSSPMRETGGMSWMSVVGMVLVVLFVVSVLGVDVFRMMGEVAQWAWNMLMRAVGGTVSVAATGTEAVVSGVSSVAEKGLDKVSSVGDSVARTSLGSSGATAGSSVPADSGLDRAIGQAPTSRTQYEPDEASSAIQGGGKAGWCYIGIDRGARACAAVSEADTCMSGQIFPTLETCQYPQLRA